MGSSCRTLLVVFLLNYSGAVRSQDLLLESFEPLNLVSVELLDLAKTGDVPALHLVGDVLARNNQTEALALLDGLVEKGDEHATYLKGRILYEGIGGHRDRALGRTLLDAAAGYGETSALLYLARLSLNFGDRSRAKRYFDYSRDWSDGFVANEAAALHSFLSSSLCARIASELIGNYQNEVLSSRLMLRGQQSARSAKAGKRLHRHRPAGNITEFTLTSKLATSVCLDPRDTDARAIASELAEAGNFWGYLLGGLFSSYGIGGPKKPELAQWYFSRAEELGGSKAVYAIAQWSEGKLHRDFLKKAAETGNLEAMRQLGEELIAAGDLKTACHWYSKLKQKHAHAGHELGYKCDNADRYKSFLLESAKGGSIQSYREVLLLERDSLERVEAIYHQAEGEVETTDLSWLMGQLYLSHSKFDKAEKFFLDAGIDALIGSGCADCVVRRLQRISHLPTRVNVNRRFESYRRKFQRLSGGRFGGSFSILSLQGATVILPCVALSLYAGWKRGFAKGLLLGVQKAR